MVPSTIPSDVQLALQAMVDTITHSIVIVVAAAGVVTIAVALYRSWAEARADTDQRENWKSSEESV